MSRRIAFTVEGYGDFPFDMLRKDECWPAGVDDAIAMYPESNYKRRQVRLLSDRIYPCEERWESFGWKVTDFEAL